MSGQPEGRKVVNLEESDEGRCHVCLGDGQMMRLEGYEDRLYVPRWTCAACAGTGRAREPKGEESR